MVPRKRVNVGRDAGDLEFTKDGWVGLIGDIDNPQRINLLKGYDVGAIAVETCAPDALTGCDTIHSTDFEKYLFLGLNVHRTNEGHQLR